MSKECKIALFLQFSLNNLMDFSKLSLLFIVLLLKEEMVGKLIEYSSSVLFLLKKKVYLKKFQKQSNKFQSVKGISLFLLVLNLSCQYVDQSFVIIKCNILPAINNEFCSLPAIN